MPSQEQLDKAFDILNKILEPIKKFKEFPGIGLIENNFSNTTFPISDIPLKNDQTEINAKYLLFLVNKIIELQDRIEILESQQQTSPSPFCDHTEA
jgi:hypothetical protein